MTYRYDAKRGRLVTALTLANTVMPSVLMSAEFWLFFVLHLLVYCANGTHAWEETFGSWRLDWEFVKVITAMTTFFEVFYANQCYTRYMSLYAMTRSMLNESYAFVFVLRAYDAEKSRGHTRMSVRYMVASMLLNFYGLKTGAIDDMAIGELKRLEILRPEEVASLQQHHPKHRSMIMLSWSSVIARKACEVTGAPTAAHASLMRAALQIRAYKQEITDTLSLPVPFQYFHLLSIMIIMNLALWAYSMGCSSSLFAPVVFFFASLIFIGMMELSSELADPFGVDEVDFPVEEWLQDCVQLLGELAEYQMPHDGLASAVSSEQPLPRGFHKSVVVPKSSQYDSRSSLPSLLAKRQGSSPKAFPHSGHAPTVSPLSSRGAAYHHLEAGGAPAGAPAGQQIAFAEEGGGAGAYLLPRRWGSHSSATVEARGGLR
mmetsp:Transcript_3021/g.8763  ORF Transcript_3021/g.8763 Transcript_3021/m.8763 type:complete len:431 (-) Transcript_3021:130-1422(-)